MRKKLLALLLCAALLCGASLPALGAEGTADAQLSQVTQAVKDVLGLDTTAYGSFQGERYEGALAPTWSLSWSGDAGSLYIEALEDGKILSYSLVEAQTEESYGGRESLPALPQGDEDAALAAAQAFLGQVLEAGLETAGDLETGSAPSLYGDSYRFTGTILLRGLPSPLRFSVTVRGSDCTVTRFSRDALETSCLGGVPAAAAETGEAEAAALLESTLSLRLEYVLPEAESTHAVLRYLPDPSHEFYVDGETGELVDLTELRQKMYGGASGGEAPEESAPSADADAGNAALTPAEQEGIQKLEGVLSSQALDQRLREEDAYGLGRYELVNASYRLIEGEEDQEDRVECTLRYSRTGEDGTWGRTFTVDARTGEVASLWSSAPWDEDREPALTEEEAQARAEAFLQSFAGDRWEHLALYEGARAALLDGGTGNAPFYTFTFARQENGYFFPTHSYTVGIDAADGSVSSLAFQYEEDVTFDDPQGIVDAEAALDAWMGTYDVALGYLYVPRPPGRRDGRGGEAGPDGVRVSRPPPPGLRPGADGGAASIWGWTPRPGSRWSRRAPPAPPAWPTRTWRATGPGRRWSGWPDTASAMTPPASSRTRPSPSGSWCACSTAPATARWTRRRGTAAPGTRCTPPPTAWGPSPGRSGTTSPPSPGPRWSGCCWTPPASARWPGWRASSPAPTRTRRPSPPESWATPPWPRAWGW